MTREDYEVLKQLPPDAAASFLQLIRRQADEEKAFRTAVVSDCDLREDESPESVLGARVHRWGWGTGGGYRTPIAKGAE